MIQLYLSICINIYIYIYVYIDVLGFLGGLVVKNLLVNAGDTGNVGLCSGSGRSHGEGNGNRILAWRIPWTEEPGGLQSIGSQRVRHN